MARKKDTIALSPKYGVNPSITHCECCGKEIGIALMGKLKGDVEAPKEIAMGLCEDCQKVVDANGLLVIEVKDGETGPNPYRTGRMVGITKEAKEKLLKDPNGNICFMEESLFSKLFSNVEFKHE